MNVPFVIGALWAGWCTLHSLMICRPVTNRLSRLLGRKYSFYRLFFNLFSLLSAAGILWVQGQFSPRLLWSWHDGWHILRGGLLLYALYMFVAGTRAYELGYFLGLQQIDDYLHSKKTAPMPFSRLGVLAWVRHPWYSGAIAFLWAAGEISDVSLALKAVLSSGDR